MKNFGISLRMATVILGVLVAMATSVASATAQAAAAKTATIKVSEIVGKGQGIEHPLIRQLIADLSIADGKKVCGQNVEFKGDTDDKAAVKKWAGRVAHLLAIGAGKVDRKFGGEIRVKAANTVAYHIADVDGHDDELTVIEYSATADSGSAPDDDVTGTESARHDVVTAISDASFLGINATSGEKLTLPSYEYLFLPRQ